MQEFQQAQKGLDKLFTKIDYNRRTGENRKQRRARERKEQKAFEKAKQPA
jgi:hypothetical protein